MAQAVAAAGWTSNCVAMRNAAGVSPDGVHVIEIGARSPLAPGRIDKLLAVLCRSDVVHVHGSTTLLLVRGLLAGRRSPKVAFTWHNSESVLELRGFRGGFERWAVRGAHTVLGSSSDVARQLTAKCRLTRPATVFVNGVPERAETAARNSGVPTILWAARLVPSKSLELLLSAAIELRKRGLRFRVLIAGAAPKHLRIYEQELHSFTETHELSDIVSFLGWKDDLSTALAGSAIGVQTSRTEGLSLALLEQMISGLAIVATDVGDTRLALNHGTYGRLIQPDDQAGLVSALEELIADTSTRDQLGRSARQHALAEYSLRAMAARAVTLYRTMLEPSAKPPT